MIFISTIYALTDNLFYFNSFLQYNNAAFQRFFFFLRFTFDSYNTYKALS